MGIQGNPEQPKTSGEKKNEVGGLILSNFKTYCKVKVTMTGVAGIQIHIEINGVEFKISEIYLYCYGRLTFDRGAEIIPQKKNSLFNKWYWDNWI